MAAHPHFDPIKTPTARRYLLLFLVLVSIYSVALLDYVFVEGRDPQHAVFEIACTALYVDCSQATNISTKFIHVLLGLTTMAIIVLFISQGINIFMQMELGGDKMAKRIGSMKGHFVVCGYGGVGKTFCEVLRKQKKPFVVVEIDPRVTSRLKDEGIPFVEGDALDANILEKAGVTRAKWVVAALDSDSANVFLTLAANEANPYIKLAARAFSEKAIGKLHRAGADYIVVPDVVGGMELAREVLGLKESHLQKLVTKK